MATDFSTSGLAAWTAADPTKALQLVLLEGIGTKDHYSFQTGVKYITKIPHISSVDVDISTGALGGYNTGSGQTAFADISLSNTPFKLFETYSKAVLTQKILGPLSKGTDPADMPFEDQIGLLKGKALVAENEKMIWQAAADASVQDLGKAIGKFDGILEQLTSSRSATGANAGNVAGYGNAAVAWTGYSDSSVIQVIESMVDALTSALPQYITVPTVMSMSPTKFSQYSRALYGLGTTITKDSVGAGGQPLNEINIPGTQIKVVSELGLYGKQEIVLTSPENIIAVYDLESEDEQLEFWYNRASRYHELTAQYKLGVQVVDPSAVILSMATTATLT